MKKEKTKRIPVERIILGVVGGVGILAVAAVAPNALQTLSMFGVRKKKHWKPYYIDTALGRLKDRGLIAFEKKNDSRFVRLTKQGEVELLKYMLKEKGITKKRWDGKWRMIIFDIKEYKRVVRDKIRRELQALGFVQLQQSVWVFPYPCEEVAIMLKADNQIGKEVLYVEADRIENDKKLRKVFRLSGR